MGKRGRRRRGRDHTVVNIVIDLPTLLGLAEHPARLDGYGPIPADLARRLAADASWRRMITDPITRRLLDRNPHLPARSPARRLRPSPRPGLRPPRLHPTRRGLPTRPRHPLRPDRPRRRTHHRRGPAPPLRPPPQRQNPPRLGHRHPNRRHPLHPQPPRPRLHPPTQPLPRNRLARGRATRRVDILPNDHLTVSLGGHRRLHA